MTPEVRAASEALATELGQMGPNVLPRLIREYLECRDEANRFANRREALRKELLPILEDVGGSYIDEVAGVRVHIERQVRWEFDSSKLHAAVKHGVRAEEFADALVTSVDKAVVQGWIDKGLIRERDVAPAKVGTKVIAQIMVDTVGK